MTIHLPDSVERSIQAAVQAGRFVSADEAVVAAWRVYEQSTRPAISPPHEALAEFHRQLLADGVISALPDARLDTGDDEEPVIIQGEPLSETILRERR